MIQMKPFKAPPFPIEVDSGVRSVGANLLFEFRVRDPDNRVLGGFVPAEYVAADFKRADELWRRTCFEAFWGPPGQERYWELNLSPNAPRWNLYSFDGYRTPEPPRPAGRGRLLEMKVEADCLRCLREPPEAVRGPEMNLTAVIQTGREVYHYAIHHPGTKPDFHARAGFQRHLVRA